MTPMFSISPAERLSKSSPDMVCSDPPGSKSGGSSPFDGRAQSLRPQTAPGWRGCCPTSNPCSSSAITSCRLNTLASVWVGNGARSLMPWPRQFHADEDRKITTVRRSLSTRNKRRVNGVWRSGVAAKFIAVYASALTDRGLRPRPGLSLISASHPPSRNRRRQRSAVCRLVPTVMAACARTAHRPAAARSGFASLVVAHWSALEPIVPGWCDRHGPGAASEIR